MPPSHYFDADPSVVSRPKAVDLVLPDLSVRLTTDRGVFAADGVDPGTRILLAEAPMPGPGDTDTVVDVGCGYGPIAVTVALRAPGAAVWAVDVNARARELCAANAEAAGVANVTVVAPDEVPGDLRVDRIYANPPIRIGKSALHHLLATWLEQLTPTGRAWLVVQKHLGSDSLHHWLDDQGWPTTRLLSRKGYRVLEVRSREGATTR